MSPGFAVNWQDIALPDNLVSFQRDELTKIVRDDVPIEGERLFQRRCLQKSEELPFAGHNVKRMAHPGEVLFSGGNDGVGHDTQRSRPPARGCDVCNRHTASRASAWGVLLDGSPHTC